LAAKKVNESIRKMTWNTKDSITWNIHRGKSSAQWLWGCQRLSFREIYLKRSQERKKGRKRVMNKPPHCTLKWKMGCRKLLLEWSTPC
jgi:hypothetical protein